MKKNRSMPEATIIPVLAYPDVSAAAQWLCDAFGFKVRLRIGNHRVQLSFAGGAVVVSQGEPANKPAASHSIMVRVSEIDEHFARAQRSGARILAAPSTFPYGERQYTVADVGGHLWTFSESVTDVDPRVWGGELLGEESDT